MDNKLQNITVLGFYKNNDKVISDHGNVMNLDYSINNQDFINILNSISTESILVVDLERISLDIILKSCQLPNLKRNEALYLPGKSKKLLFDVFDTDIFRGDDKLLASPILFTSKEVLKKAYVNQELDSNPLQSIIYSLNKVYTSFRCIESSQEIVVKKYSTSREITKRFLFNIPFNFIKTGRFLTTFFNTEQKWKREMVYRFLILLFGVFSILYMPYISKDYGISGDEYVDYRHTGYVIDYFTNGDKAALDQPKTALHLYGNSVQVLSTVVARIINADDVYRVRHFICALVGALGVIMIGFLGMRFGGGLCGLIAMILLFFYPRYFGHSMNNLKDIPFAVGYLMAIFYFIRIFDNYPMIKLRHAIGAIFGIGLALGTRSGGLLLYPYFFMYAGLYYISYVGVKDFFNFWKYRKEVENFFFIFILVGLLGYLLSIVTWPFALSKPFTNVVVSLKQFTNYNVGLKTIFEGKQVISTMLPLYYAPKYLLIITPIITLIGFAGYFITLFLKKRELSILSFFLIFAAIFPVYWVIHEKSNLYGGIRHLLFVVPFIILLAAKFWTIILLYTRKYLKLGMLIVFIGLLFLPVKHMVKNHPNDYIYFNEIVGNFAGTYGNYESDYYYNSLKEAVDWFKANVDYKDREITIITNHSQNLDHYFRHEPNVKITYARYYDKYNKDWDYMIYANVYLSSYQLRNKLYPVKEGHLYSVMVDGLPVCAVNERVSKDDLAAINLFREGKLDEALPLMEKFVNEHPFNEEMWLNLARIYHATEQYEKSYEAANSALKIHSEFGEAYEIKAQSGIELKKYNEALHAIDNILAINMYSAQAYYLKAYIYYVQRQDKLALKEINNCLRYGPTHKEGIELGGELLMRNGSYKQAIDIYNRLVQNRTANENTLIKLAECFIRLRDYEQFDKIFVVIDRDGKNKYAHQKLLLRKALQQADMQTAKDLIGNIEIKDDADLYVLFAVYDSMADKNSESLQNLNKAIELDSYNIDAGKFKPQLEKGNKIKF